VKKNNNNTTRVETGPAETKTANQLSKKPAAVVRRQSPEAIEKERVAARTKDLKAMLKADLQDVLVKLGLPKTTTYSRANLII
jgi:hypothetical protein